MFFDPGMTSTVPTNKLDAATIMLHEIGHGLVFNSFRQDDGSLPTLTWSDGQVRPYQFVYDTFVTLGGSAARFNGPNSNLVGGGLALAGLDNIAHAGIDDLLFPSVAFSSRRFISDIDVAVAQDIGLPIATC